jgi:hypothetical protein
MVNDIMENINNYLWQDTDIIKIKPKVLTLLKFSRPVSLIIIILAFAYSVFDTNEDYLVFLTNWGIILTLVYFTIATFNIFLSAFIKTGYILCEIVWGLNWCISILFWTYIFPQESNPDVLRDFSAHSLPLLATVFDFGFNNVYIVRRHYVFLVLVVVFYSIVNISYTLARTVIYPGMTYDNAITYIIFILAFLIIGVFLELGKSLKKKQKNKIPSDENFYMYEGDLAGVSS